MIAFAKELPAPWSWIILGVAVIWCGALYWNEFLTPRLIKWRHKRKQNK